MSAQIETYEKEYRIRMNRWYDELKWLYMELYGERYEDFHDLCADLYANFQARDVRLKESDLRRSADPQWYRGNDMLGMMLYVNAFAKTLDGVREKIPYFLSCGVNYIHLMPFLDSPAKKNDGGYAVSDFRKVKSEFGTMEDLKSLTEECRKQGISVCMDFVMNHTSEEHEWARRAKAGEIEYQNRYFFYDNYDIPAQFEQTVPQVFPTTAPGNFTRNPDTGKVVMTTFYPYQWDLNYRNPTVLREMMGNLLFLVNQGIDIIRLDAVPYIWKEPGTKCRNLPQVHNIVRMVRIICEIVCPGVLLLGEVVMEPDKVAPYFGTVEKPECHMLYNVTTMASLWHTVATKDVRLLRRQLDLMHALPKEYIFQNYLRCHDDLGWGLDYDFLRDFGMAEVPHKKFLNDFFTGKFYGSFARGELYNDSAELGDARLCGTTASLCGVERAAFEDPEKAIRYDLTLHAFMLAQSGIPVIYSGDEIGQTNDYSYHFDPKKQDDSRYLHRGDFRWDLEERRHTEGSIQQRIFDGLRKLEQIRSTHDVFRAIADVRTVDTGDDTVLGVLRSSGTDKLVTLYNFSGDDRIAWICEEDGMYIDLISGIRMEAKDVRLPAFGCRWLLRE
ncbi:MAG: alpha-amylase family protein [Clostridiales bacterium]|nr:alpha-amylase family protein [Clostridiales bacterium]